MRDANSWPVNTRATKDKSPILGPETIPPNTANAPINPPSHNQVGNVVTVLQSGKGARETNKQIIRPSVPTIKEISEAVIGFDMRCANSALIPT